MEKKLVKHGNSLALVIDKPLLSILGIDEKTNLVISIENNNLVIKPSRVKKMKTNKNDIDDIAQKIMKKYGPVFKKACQIMKTIQLTSSHVETPLGTMLAIADNNALYLLEFTDRPGLEPEIQRLQKALRATITSGKTLPITSIETELQNYFAGTLTSFKTPINLIGSPFARTVWQELQKIPYGSTWSYQNLATAIGNRQACRAVARANSSNRLAIIVPCHRVINTNGTLGGYSGGIQRKQWLLEHEKKCFLSNL